jgi:transposase
MMRSELSTVWIDVAKRTLQVSLLRLDGKRRHKAFANDAAGHHALLGWLDAQGAGHGHSCLEATGTYGEAVATALVDAGHVVSVVNPAAVKAFAASQLRRTKTDRVDADVLVDFCSALRPAPWATSSASTAG